MSFNSIEFIGFLVVALVAFWATRGALRRAVLLLTSLVFYGIWDLRFLALLLVVIGITFVAGIRVEGADDPRIVRRWLIGAIVVDLAVLGLFKYFNFFVDSMVDLLGLVGFDGSGPALRIFLPIGISFYVFESISYLVDISRGRAAASRDPVRVGLFLSYFPKALAGPIERPAHLIPQLDCAQARPRAEEWRSGAMLFLLGLLQKVVLADLAAPIVNDVYSEPGKMSGPALLGATYAFAIQIYGDFAGYTNMARGISRLFGIDLIKNFDQPYLSQNPVEFWRRWHISLSTWLRDYLYIPLGGNRHGNAATYRNLMVTMLLGGLWHGASWNFVIWGGLHGLYLVGHRLIVRVRGPAPADRPLWKQVIAAGAFFQLVCLGWMFFRFATFSDAVTSLERILTVSGGRTPARLAFLPVLLVLTLGMDLVLERRPTTERFEAMAPHLQGALCGLAVVAIVIASGGQPSPFIYFAF